MKLPFVPCNMRCEKIVEARDCYVELFEDRIKYVVDFTGSYARNCDDPLQGWEQAETRFIVHAMKAAIQTISFSITPEGKWAVTLYISGARQDIDIYFKNKDEQKGLEFFKKLEAWWLNLSQDQPS